MGMMGTKVDRIDPEVSLAKFMLHIVVQLVYGLLGIHAPGDAALIGNHDEFHSQLLCMGTEGKYTGLETELRDLMDIACILVNDSIPI